MLYPLSYGRLVRAEGYRFLSAPHNRSGNFDLRSHTPWGILGADTESEESIMCSPAICPVCNKYTWSGCGNHIEQALAGIPQEKLCNCN